MTIDGCTALVTGGGSGIGLGTAARLANDGVLVTICGRTESKLVDAVEQIGHGARYIVADVTVEADVVAAIQCAARPTGRLDIVLANAGGSHHMGPLAEAEVEAFRSTVDLNLTGTFLTIKHASQHLAAQSPSGGAIVAISSGAGHFPHRFLPVYGAAKAGRSEERRVGKEC